MHWLNYHHLLYFYVVAREGGIVPASKVLHVSHPTISTQIRKLEDALGQPLFERTGRKLVLSEMGRVAYRYAEEIFSLGQEMVDAVQGRPTGKGLRLTVGITMVLPKLIVRQLLQPAFELDTPVHLACHEDDHERLLGRIASHELDLVLSDMPVAPGSSFRVFNHELGQCGVTFFGAPALASELAPGFPGSLDGAPALLPTPRTALRRSLDRWFHRLEIRPAVAAELADAALLKVFGQDGMGVFPAPTAIEHEITSQYDVEVIGRTEEVVERFYAISVERRVKHPAVLAICDAARQELFGEA